MRKTARRAVFVIGLLSMSYARSIPAQQDATISDKEIRVVDYQEIKYPPLALQTRVQGLVVVQAKLDNDGKVAEASAISGSELLAPHCLANVKKWRFQPNAHHAVVIVYNFRLSYAAGCKSAGSFFTLEAPNFVTVTDCAMTVQP